MVGGDAFHLNLHGAVARVDIVEMSLALLIGGRAVYGSQQRLGYVENPSPAAQGKSQRVECAIFKVGRHPGNGFAGCLDTHQCSRAEVEIIANRSLLAGNTPLDAG